MFLILGSRSMITRMIIESRDLSINLQHHNIYVTWLQLYVVQICCELIHKFWSCRPKCNFWGDPYDLNHITLTNVKSFDNSWKGYWPHLNGLSKMWWQSDSHKSKLFKSIINTIVGIFNFWLSSVNPYIWPLIYNRHNFWLKYLDILSISTKSPMWAHI